jgi:nucleoid-associated protein YgaU
MNRDWGRGVGALVVLGALWVLVYWWWEPRHGKIVFEDGPGMNDRSPLGGGDPGTTPARPVSNPASVAASGPGRATASTGRPVGPPAPTVPRIAVVPPSFRLYTVKSGDTWETIASRELGSPDLWHDLTRANPLMTDLRAGRQIKIPTDPGNIQGRPVAEAPAGAPPAPVVEYTVKGGDTLGGIAKAYYGSTTFKDLIFTANRDTLEREDQLKIGQKLKLPPKPN